MQVECEVKFFRNLLKKLVDMGFDKTNLGITEDKKDSPSRMRITSINKAKNILVFFKLYSGNFKKIYCEKDVNVCISILNFYKLLNSIKDDNSVFVLYNKNKEQLGLSIKDTNKNFVLNISEYVKLEFESTVFESYIRMPVDDFLKTCGQMHEISEFVEIKTIGEQLIFRTEGDSESREIIHGKNDKKISIDSSEIVKGVYELKYLIAFSEWDSQSNNVEIYMKNDYPLIIKYSVENMYDMYFCLSPVTPNHINDSDN